MRHLLLALLFCPLTAYGDEPSRLEQADKIYAVRTATAGASEALALYENEAAENPGSVEARWKAARACYWIADHAESKRDKIKMFEKGIALAEAATAADPKSADAHFWLAGLYGSYGEAKGIMKSLMMLKPIRNSLNAINRINDRYQGGAGYRVLGIVDYKVPGFAGGSKKRAIELLNKALAIDPANPFNQYYVAEFYATAGKDKSKAREHLKILSDLATTDDVDAPDLGMIKAKGQKLLDQIGT